MNVRPYHPRPRRAHPARSAGPHVPALNAMRTAEWVFATTDTRAELLATATDALAIHPGHMCLVSLVDGETLRPVGAAHVLASRANQLRAILDDWSDDTCADAFSRAAEKRRGPLRMRLGHPDLYKLWLPAAYREYALRTRVSTVMAAPLAMRGKVLGTFLLWREGEDAPHYTAADQAYVAGLAVRLALALRAYAGPAPDMQAGRGRGGTAMAFVPDDARAEIDREDLETGEAEVALSTVEVPEDVQAELDADTRARVETPGDDARRVAPLQEIDEKYRG